MDTEAKKKRVVTTLSRSVAVEQIEAHKAKMAKLGWTFDRTEEIGNGVTSHVWVYYRKS